MAEPRAYLNGEWLPLSQARLSILDLGLQGIAVAEMIRTFHHRPFRLEQHLQRLQHSLEAVGFDPGLSLSELADIGERLVRENSRLIPAAHDLGLVYFVTAGVNPTYLGAAGGQLRRPSVGVQTFPLPFELWAAKYEAGQRLVIPQIRQLAAEALDPTIKHRSRLHWHLAEREARLVDPQANALLLDQQGHLTETASGNLCVVRGGVILTPAENALKGVSLQVVAELAADLEIPLRRVDLPPSDALAADEVFTTSTPYCLLPVTWLNGCEIGDGAPGPVFRKLLATWSELVGVDIAEQMRSGADERTARGAGF